MITESRDTNIEVALQPVSVAAVNAKTVTKSPDYARAFVAWESLLGKQYVQHDSAACAAYATTTIPHGTLPAGVLRPESTSEVQKLVDVARRFNVPLYPISRGNNWGYGDACARTNGQVIVELSRMKRILDFDDELGVVTIEPGITQQLLRNFLDDRRAEYMVPTHGGGPDCSIVGNLLERGYGITPITDHFGALTSLEAVLASGEIYRSALATRKDSRVDRLFKWGIGPYLDGLFSQSNLGIVTRATIALARRPTQIEAFLFSIESDESLSEVVSRLRALISTLGSTVGSINLMNRLRVLAMTIPYPRESLGDSTTLPEAVIEELGIAEGIGAWTGAGALYGSTSMVAAARREVKRVLGPIVKKLRFVDRPSAAQASNWLSWIPGNLGRHLRSRLATVQGFLDVVSGIPSRVALPLAYWISGEPNHSRGELNPAHDGCGLIWYSPLVPMDGGMVREYVAMATSVCRRHGIEPLITFTSLSDRVFDSTLPILFVRHDTQTAHQADQCYLDLFRSGRALGCVPYRLGANHMHLTSEFAPEFWRMVQKLKASLDPCGILSPGRYCPLED